MRAPEFWGRDRLAAHMLSPLGAAYGLAGRLRRHLVRPVRAAIPVICVGDLTVGGAGKTPVAMALAARLMARGRRPHLLTRGYGGRLPGPVRVDPGRHDAAAVGDEALLLAEVAPAWCARDRVRGAAAAAAAGADVLILDDGFQNPHLHQDLALLAVDGGAGFGNGRLLPAGPLREPLAAGFARAAAVVRLGADEAGIEHLLPARVPRLCARLGPGSDAPDLEGRRVVAFAGIARPEKFRRSLVEAGARLVGWHGFADHHRYRRHEALRLLDEAEGKAALCVTTAKDRWRLPADLRPAITIWSVAVSWQDPGALDRLLDRLDRNGRNAAEKSAQTLLAASP